jgi:hypothetical protein
VAIFVPKEGRVAPAKPEWYGQPPLVCGAGTQTNLSVILERF